MHNDRRTFLKHVGNVTAVVVAARSLTGSAATQEQLSMSPASMGLGAAQPLASGKVQTALFLANEQGQKSFAGWLTSVAGGSSQADVVTEKVGADGGIKKHIRGLRFDDITLSCGASMSEAFFEWVKASFDGHPARRDGTVVALNYNGSIIDTLTFEQALISEIAFPALDASSKQPAQMTLKISPQAARFDLGAGTKLSVVAPPSTNWQISNFKLQIEGLDQASAQVQKIDAIVIKQSFLPLPADPTAPADLPGPLDVSDLAVTLPEAGSTDLYDWHDAFLQENNADNADAGEKKGTLQFLSPNLQEAFFTLTFSNLGPFLFSPPSSSDSTRQVTGQLYCEGVKFDYKASWS